MNLSMAQNSIKNWKIGISKELLSDTLVSAIQLAGKIIEWDKSKSIMINYYTKGANVEDDFLKAFTNKTPTINAALNKKTIYGWFDKGTDKVNNKLNLNADLVKLCKRIKIGDVGYNRLIFFVAITIIHESTHWLFYHFKQGGKPENLISSSCACKDKGIPDEPKYDGEPEVGYDWEFKLFGGNEHFGRTLISSPS